jgi:nicotinate phosphoribosyltransferase
VASKTARICLTAHPDPVMEFGLRRAQGPDGGLTGSRAAYIGGADGTSNVEAGRRFGIPVLGTHAHSWVMSYPDELAAFKAYLEAFPDKPTLLVDTYQTVESGVPNAIEAFREAAKRGWKGRPAIRIDSGDLAADSIVSHRLFSEAGMADPVIVASNELDEYLIADLKRQGAKINAWGVGTNLITAFDHPALNGIYKLAAVREQEGWVSKIKISGNPDKTTDPGVKSPVRYSLDGGYRCDILYGWEEDPPLAGQVVGVNRTLLYRGRRFGPEVEGRAILAPLFRKGRLVKELPSLNEVRRKAREDISGLPAETLRLRNPDIYPVMLSEALADAKARVLKSHDSRTSNRAMRNGSG